MTGRHLLNMLNHYWALHPFPTLRLWIASTAVHWVWGHERNTCPRSWISSWQSNKSNVSRLFMGQRVGRNHCASSSVQDNEVTYCVVAERLSFMEKGATYCGLDGSLTRNFESWTWTFGNKTLADFRFLSFEIDHNYASEMLIRHWLDSFVLLLNICCYYEKFNDSYFITIKFHKIVFLLPSALAVDVTWGSVVMETQSH